MSDTRAYIRHMRFQHLRRAVQEVRWVIAQPRTAIDFRHRAVDYFHALLRQDDYFLPAGATRKVVIAIVEQIWAAARIRSEFGFVYNAKLHSRQSAGAGRKDNFL